MGECKLREPGQLLILIKVKVTCSFTKGKKYVMIRFSEALLKKQNCVQCTHCLLSQHNSPLFLPQAALSMKKVRRNC